MKDVVIFEYDNYRVFLKELYTSLKQTKPQFSYRYFSQKAGFRSPNFLQLVIEGKRNLSAESIEKFIHALKLNRREGDYFRILVHLNQAKTIDERKLYAEQLMRFGTFRYIYPLRREQFRYYADWYNLPVRELTALPGFSEEPEWIARSLIPPISPQQARKSVDLLLQLGLLERDPSGRLVQTDAFVSTGDEVTAASVVHYHREMIRKGTEAIERFEPAERDISAVTMALSDKGFREVKALVQRFRKEVLAIANQDDQPQDVYQLNFQLFPLARPPREDPDP